VHYRVLATDYDETLATEGRVQTTSIEALQRLRDSGRRLVLVTGRILENLRTVFPGVDLFDRVVAENGATLWWPGTDERLLAPPPPAALVEALRSRGIPFNVGRVVVAGWEPHQAEVLRTIRELKLELRAIFNKQSVMVLPPDVDKRTGLLAALETLGLTLGETVAVGDAENDQVMLAAAGCGVAVANALASLKESADLVTEGVAGAGVEEVARRLLDGDLGGA
jgi:hydroxymethylpyrimidine pyrophosphatase-like HAD family hydrolase